MNGMTTIWTALPGGVTGSAGNRRLRLSAYVTMRLTIDGGGEDSLSGFPAALNWPALFQTGTFALSVSGASGPAVTAKIVSAPPDPVMWRDLFTESTRVSSHEPDDFTQRPFNSYHATAVHDQLRAGHQRLSATSPVELPTQRHLRAALPELHLAFGAGTGQRLPEAPAVAPVSDKELAGFHATVARDMFRPSSGNSIHRNMAHLVSSARQRAVVAASGTAILVIPDEDTPDSPFKQLYGFHYRKPLDPKSTPQPPAPVQNPAGVLDFHGVLTALAQYPALLRSLGLVLDLEIPEGSLPPSPLNGGAGLVQVTPAFSGVAPIAFSPSTAYILEGDLFAPASRDQSQPECIAGLLNLAIPGAFSLMQGDVDSLGLKTLNMAASNTLPASQDDSATGGTPAFGKPGISIARTGYAAILAQRFATAFRNNRQLASNPPLPVTLFAEDLTRGFRFDIFDGKAGWRSLHSRNGSYVFRSHPGGPLTVNLSDEGISQPAASQLADGTDDDKSQIFVHDSLMHWKGWSLAAPHPGKTLGGTGPATVSSQAIAGGFPLEVNFTCAPGTLPRLRFQSSYQVRARAVDLAGNSLGLADANGVISSVLPTLGRPVPVLPPGPDGFVVRRFEAVPAPHLVPREKFTQGESSVRMVIRSNSGEAAAGMRCAADDARGCRPPRQCRHLHAR